MAHKYRIKRSLKSEERALVRFEVMMRSLGYSSLDFAALSLPELYERLCIYIQSQERGQNA